MAKVFLAMVGAAYLFLAGWCALLPARWHSPDDMLVSITLFCATSSTGQHEISQIEEGLFYSESKPNFSESKINSVLHDRSYLGFIWFRGGWRPGRHEVLIDPVTWDKVL